MKVWLKRLLLGFLALLLVALGAVVVFVLTFNPNHYKHQLESLVQQHYDRTLAIRGDITLSVFPRIGLSLQDVSLSDRHSARRFASVGDVQLTVALWPLLFRRVVVDYVSITDFKTWVQRDADGRLNFDDLVTIPASQAASSFSVVGSHQEAFAATTQEPIAQSNETQRAGLQIDIAGLELRGGEIHLDDRLHQITGDIHDLRLSTGRITDGQPVDLTIKGRLSGVEPVADARFEGQGRVSISPLRRIYGIERGRLEVHGNVAALQDGTMTLQGAAAWNTYLQTIEFSGLQAAVQGKVAGSYPMDAVDMTLSTPVWKLDRTQAGLTVSGLELRAKGQTEDQALELALSIPTLDVSPERAKGEPIQATFKHDTSDTTFAWKALLQDLAGDAYEIKFKKADMESVYQEGDRTVSMALSSPLSWQVFRQRASLPAIKGDLDIKDAVRSEADASFPFIGRLDVDGYQETLKGDLNSVIDGGSIAISLDADRAAQPGLRFDLMADRLNLNALLPEASEPDDDTKPEAMPPRRPVPLQWLTRLDFEGGAAVDKLEVGRVVLERVRAGVESRKGQLRVSNLRAQLYGGEGTARLIMGPDQKVETGFSVTDVNLGALSRALWGQQRWSGRGAIEGYLMSRGETIPALVAGASGQLVAEATQGALLGMDVARTIDEADNVLRNAFSSQLPAMEHEYQTARRTAFDRWETRFSVTRGQGHIDQFILTGPEASIRAGEPAELDLVNGQMELLLIARAEPAEDRPHSRLRGQDIPIRVSGPLDRLNYSVQWRDIHDPVVQDAIDEGLLEKLGHGADGPPGFLQLAPLAPNASESSSNLSDPIKSVGEALKGLLQK